MALQRLVLEACPRWNPTVMRCCWELIILPSLGLASRPEAASCFPPQVLLTLDDDLDTVRRDKIPVF